MRKIHVFSDERPSKRSMPFRTASQVSCTTSSAIARLETYIWATRRRAAWYMRMSCSNACSSRLRSASTSRISSSPRACSMRTDCNESPYDRLTPGEALRPDRARLGIGRARRRGEGDCQVCGAEVALVESTRWGGSCPNVACKPTKAYLVVAELVHDINELAGKLGIDVGPARVDMARVKARKDSIKKPQAKWVEDLQGAGFDTYEGEAELVDAHTVRVGDEELTADRILIATGSRTAVPPIEGIDEIDWIDHVSALELTELPESMLVVGGGPVGLEFAQIFARFGSRVTIVQGADRHLAPLGRAGGGGAPGGARGGRRSRDRPSSYVKSVRRDGRRSWRRSSPRKARARASCGWRRPARLGPRAERRGAASRRARDRARPARNRRRRAHAHLRRGIWAAGDVTGRYQFTPIAQYQARIAVDDMFGLDPPRSRLLGAADRDLHRARARGRRLTEQDADERGVDHEVVTHEIKHVQRSSYKDQKRGLYKIVYDPSHAPRPRAPRRRAGTAATSSRGSPPAARRHGRRPRADAPRLPDLRRGREGRRRAGAAAARRDGRDLQLTLKEAPQVPSPADPKACRT